MLYTKEEISQIAINIFGEDRVDVTTPDEGNNSRFSITIYFPELIITNSEAASHRIKGMFFRINVKIDDVTDVYKASINLSGTRHIFSLKELVSNYCHSHLPSASVYNYENFCLGNSDFYLIKVNLEMSLEEENWQLFFLSIENYLKWESLEGGPHIKIREIKYNNSIHSSELEKELYRISGNLPKETFEYNNSLSLITSHPSLYLYFNENSLIRNYIKTSKEYIKEQFLCYKKTLEEKKGKIIFKGESIPCIIEEGEKEETPNISPEIVAVYKSIIQNQCIKFNKQYSYERRKAISKTFGENGTNIQACCNNHREIAEAN